MLHKKRLKAKGFVMLSAIMAMLIILMIANGFMNMYGGQFTYLQAGKEASKGQQYAELVGEKVKLEGVDAEEVTDKTGLDEITGNDADKGWEYTYEISEGTEDEDGNVFKVATIKIYKEGENSPRYTYEVPLSSSGSNLGEVGSNDKGYYWKLPNGLIFQWGITNDGKKGVDFPIPFKNVYSITMGNKNNNLWTPHLRDITVKGFKATAESTNYSYGGYWFAIGN